MDGGPFHHGSEVETKAGKKDMETGVMADTNVADDNKSTASQNTKTTKGTNKSTKTTTASPKTPRKPRAKQPTAKPKKTASEATTPRMATFADTGCRENACEANATTGGYCRLHYIKNWKRIKRKEVILQEGKLEKYIRELVSKYPEKYLEAIRIDLLTQTEFHKIIQDLDLDESIDDFESENNEAGDAIIDSIRREFEEDPDAF